MTGPLERYRAQLATGAIEPDPAQERVAHEFDRLYFDLLHAIPQRQGLQGLVNRLLRNRRDPIRGIYLWGTVGRGKTYLMDQFYAAVPFSRKRRQHFHRFMADVHHRLKQLHLQEDPLEVVAAQIAEQTQVLCFDEFAVSDIADAMILGNLFRGLFNRGVSLVATSNTPPADLYRDGLQRQRFLPAIALIEKHCEVVNMGGELDYRLQFLKRSDLYQHPVGEHSRARLTEFFETMEPDASNEAGSIDVNDRSIHYMRNGDGTIWFDFQQICDGPRSQNDYIEISRLYQAVFVSRVPRFTPLLENQARRFIALVDEFYDRKVKLVISAAVSIEELYAGERLKHEFARTRSRLQEMQSEEYLHAPHKP
jgi:cell division protein ZapE